MAHYRHVLSLPTSNLDRLTVKVPAKADGGMVGAGRALPLPMRGPPQKNERFIKAVPSNPAPFGEAALKRKGGKAVHPEEKLTMGKGRKFHH